MNAFIEELKIQGLSPRTIESYSKTVSDFLSEYGELTADTVASWRGSSRKWKASTVRQKVAALSKYAEFTGVDVDFGKLPSIKVEVPCVVTREDAEKMIERCTNTKHRLAMRLMSYIGLRISEACSLRWEDVDLTRKTITVIRKGGNKQVLPILGDTLYHSLTFAHMSASGDEYVLGGVTSAAIYKAITRLAAQVGIEAHPHAFRHGFAVSAAKSDVSIPAIQKMLGHSNPMTTSRYLSGLQMDADELRAEFGE